MRFSIDPLQHDGEILQIIPASGVDLVAVFNDGGRYPVVAWALTRQIADLGESEPSEYEDVVGLIVEDTSAHLITVTDAKPRFVRYEFGYGGA